MKPESERLDHHGIRVTAAQWAKVEANGGLEWLRALIDGAGPAGHEAPEQSVTELEWVKWTDLSGYGAPPVEAGAAVAYRIHTGEVLTTDYPHCLDWGDWGGGPRIVEYRLLTAEEVAEQVPWIEWSCGECPVDPATVVQCRLHDYGRNDAGLAGLERWEHVDPLHGNYDANIVAYRVVAA